MNNIVVSQEKINKWDRVKVPIYVFFIHLIVLLPVIFLSIDFTDSGHSLINQMMAKKIGLKRFNDTSLILLSDFIGGYWLALIGPMGIIGARLGGLLAYALSASIIAKMLQAWIKDSKLIILTCMFSSMVIMTLGSVWTAPPVLLDYYTISMLLGVIIIYLMSDLISCPTLLKSIVLGCLFAVLFMCRMTMIPLLVLPLIALAFVKKNERLLLISIYFFFILIITIAYFILNQVVESPITKILEFFRTSDVSDSDYKKIYLCDAVASIRFFAITMVATFIGGLFNKKIAKYLFLGFILFLFFRQFLDYHNLIYSYLGRKGLFFRHFLPKLYAIKSILVMGAIFGSLSVLGYIKMIKNSFYSKEEKNKFLFLVVCSFVFSVCFAGSNIGPIKMGYGFWYFFALAAIYAQNQDYLKDLLQKTMMIICCFSLIVLCGYPYRDYLFPYNHLGIIKRGNLKGGVTLKQKADAINELYDVVTPYIQQKETILAYPSIPLIYFLFNKMPVTNFGWLTVLTKGKLLENLNILPQKEMPGVIIKAKFVAAYPDAFLLRHPLPTSEKITMINNAIDQLYETQLIFSNEYFEVFLPIKIKRDQYGD